MIEFDTSEFASAFADMLSRVEDSVGESALRTIGFAGAEIFRDQAKQNALAHKKTGLLFDNIIVKRLEEESEGGKQQAYMVTVRNGRVRGDGAYYWRWVEFGHRFVPKNKKKSKKTGRTIGWKAHRKAATLKYGPAVEMAYRTAAELEFGTASTPAYAFMRPAYESKKAEAISVMTQTLRDQLERNATR